MVAQQPGEGLSGVRQNPLAHPPSGYSLTYTYSTGLNDSIGRLSSITDSSGTLESYDYLGLGTVVRRGHSQPGVDLTYIGASAGAGGDKYVGLDSFGRVVDQDWDKSGTATDRFSYTYDRDSNRLTKGNSVNTAFNEVYTYDNLNQLSTFNRGSGTHTQSWDYDALGNWDSVTTDASTQTRTANKQNEITSVSGATTPTYDANGNMTTDETGKQYVYDAWNRIKIVKNSGGTTLKTYSYDGLNRRISETASGTTTDLYYSSSWQVLEETVSGTTKSRYVWSPVYVDALILRDRDADGSSGNGLEERLWVQQDANFNVTALVNGSGTVVERYAYDSFGKVTYLNASWTTIGASAYGWQYLHQGGRLDASSGLYYFRNRDYSPTLGRWVSMDPIGFLSNTENLYLYSENNPINNIDPKGEQPEDQWFGFPKVFWNWAHNQDEVKFKDRDLNYKEAKELHEKWTRQNKPPRDNTRTRGKPGRRGGKIDGRLAAIISAEGILIGVVGYWYGEYVNAGEESGNKLAIRVGLGRSLQILGAAGSLPCGTAYDMLVYGKLTHIVLVQKDGQWYFTAWHTEEHWSVFYGSYEEAVDDIRIGEVPAYHDPISCVAPTIANLPGEIREQVEIVNTHNKRLADLEATTRGLLRAIAE